jgi:hypothetical protein
VRSASLLAWASRFPNALECPAEVLQNHNHNFYNLPAFDMAQLHFSLAGIKAIPDGVVSLTLHPNSHRWMPRAFERHTLRGISLIVGPMTAGGSILEPEYPDMRSDIEMVPGSSILGITYPRELGGTNLADLPLGLEQSSAEELPIDISVLARTSVPRRTTPYRRISSL